MTDTEMTTLDHAVLVLRELGRTELADELNDWANEVADRLEAVRDRIYENLEACPLTRELESR